MLYEDKICFHIIVNFELLDVETEVEITARQTCRNGINNWHNSSETKTPCGMFPF